jgi:hypothetical protein
MPCDSGNYGQCRKTNACYQIICESCQTAHENQDRTQGSQARPASQPGHPTIKMDPHSQYLGETSKNLADRSREHLRLYRAKSELSPLWKHCQLDHGGDMTIPTYSMRLKTRHVDPLSRLITEGVLIKHAKPESLMNSRGEAHTTAVARVTVHRTQGARAMPPPSGAPHQGRQQQQHQQQQQQGSQVGMEQPRPHQGLAPGEEPASGAPLLDQDQPAPRPAGTSTQGVKRARGRPTNASKAAAREAILRLHHPELAASTQETSQMPSTAASRPLNNIQGPSGAAAASQVPSTAASRPLNNIQGPSGAAAAPSKRPRGRPSNASKLAASAPHPAARRPGLRNIKAPAPVLSQTQESGSEEE